MLINCRINEPAIHFIIAIPHQENPSFNKSASRKLAHKFLHMFAKPQLAHCSALH